MKFLNYVKSLLRRDKIIFFTICKRIGVNLEYSFNKSEISIFQAIFEKREYADYFPFYEEINVIDIGAHYGYFSIFAHLNSAKNSKIIAVEPNKANFEMLTKNIVDSNSEKIIKINSAIGGKAKMSKLFVGDNVNHSLLEDYSLLSEDKGFEEVQIMTLEEIIVENDLERIDFLKLDCEGAEYDILNKLPKHIFDKIITISMEFHDLKDRRFTGDTILKILNKNNFKIVKYEYEETRLNLNYGKIIGTKILSE